MLLMRGAVFLLVSSVFLFFGSVKGMDGLLNLILSLFFKLIKIYTADEICLCHLCHATPPELSEYLRPKAFFVDL